ncbi:TIGR02679 family protein [uncultured Oscillibacter sp.]|uniref:TIGR02679 family protein n=1 Tax=uncultured Oscillibacter sp. TaxID=876091 RepID=UPI00262C9370|nr:TIGR02679 family protein [uncultured Oscillibacter sp.]
MSEQARACAAYFRSRPGYRRILEQLLKKYRSFGRAAGTVRLDDATQEECDAARGIFGRPFSPPLRFQTVRFEAALQECCFQGVSLRGVLLKEVLELYFDTEVKTKHELRQTLDSRFSAMLAQVLEQTDCDTCRRWLQALKDPQSGGYQLLRREAARDLEGTQRYLLQACRSFEQLERHTQGAVRLAVLSAQVTSDPHELDCGTLCGKLFQYLLSFRSCLDYPENAEQRDSLYYENGVLCDSISSLVTQVGLVLHAGTEEHPAYRSFRQKQEICTLNLANLSDLTGARSPSGRVYIVENEMVFTQLCDRSGQFHSPLICTSGQPSVAALRLLDLLAADGARLFYSGDLDGRGLSIAAQLWGRYPKLFEPWHMAPDDYERCCSNVVLGETSRALLRGCAGTPLETSAAAVTSSGRAGYQELLISQLEADLTETP